MARRILAYLLLAMAADQVSDPGGFVDIVATYRVGARLLGGAWAAALVVGEAAGLGLLAADQALRRGAAAVGVSVAVVWSVLAAQALARGLVVENCGCFGVHLGQPLRWWVLVEDAELVALAVWVRRGTTRMLPAAAAPGAEEVSRL